MDVGAGCLFEELYRALAPHKLNIVGGSGLAGVGVAGWMLGGGYSTKTSQYGLGVDNIESAKLVLPDGSLKEVSATENKDLFFAIKVWYRLFLGIRFVEREVLFLLGRGQQLWHNHRIHPQSSRTREILCMSFSDDFPTDAPSC